MVIVGSTREKSYKHLLLMKQTQTSLTLLMEDDQVKHPYPAVQLNCVQPP